MTVLRGEPADRTRHHKQVEEVGQEGFSRAYTRVARLCSPRSFSPWLNSIITRKVQQIWDTAGPTMINDSSLINVSDVQAFSAQQAWERGVLHVDVQATPLRLPKHQRGEVRMFYFHEIATPGRLDEIRAMFHHDAVYHGYQCDHSAADVLSAVLGGPMRRAQTSRSRT